MSMPPDVKIERGNGNKTKELPNDESFLES